MGLAESAPATPNSEGGGGGRFATVKRHFNFNRTLRTNAYGHELMRSTSVPAHVSFAVGDDIPEPVVNANLSPKSDLHEANFKSTGSIKEAGSRETLDVQYLSTDCHYTCHPQCRDLVTLDCNKSDVPDERETEQSRLEEVISLPRTAESLTNAISQQPQTEIDRIEDVPDSSVQSSETALAMDMVSQTSEERAASSQSVFDVTLEEDGATFRGFIRVHMNLCRPISVVAGTRPPSIYDILKEDSSLERTLTSFYLPRDTVKALHITSTTTTSQVIAGLLKKFKVVDNPRKFALYERYYEDGETAKVKMRRIADNETPLCLALLWSKDASCTKMFVLQENDTGDILWEAFSLPELSNFLRILDREEEEYKRQVRAKYQDMACKIREAMDLLVPSVEAGALSSSGINESKSKASGAC